MLSQFRIRSAHKRSGTGLLRGVLALTILAGSTSSSVAANYTFSVEPAYQPERTQEIYKPLMAYLQKATGESFTLVTSRNYHFYWRDVHASTKTDFAFDEAHLTDYRIIHDKYEPLARAAEPTSYSLVVSDADLAKKGVAGLVGHSIVSMASPNLGYTLLLEMYPNPVSQPDIRSSAASFRDAVDSIFAGENDAAMIPTFLKNEYPNLITVKTTRQFAGQCVSASPQVPPEVREKVRSALLKLDADPNTEKLLIDIGVSKFATATAKEYEDAEHMLKNSFGY